MYFKYYEKIIKLELKLWKQKCIYFLTDFTVLIYIYIYLHIFYLFKIYTYYSTVSEFNEKCRVNKTLH